MVYKWQTIFYATLNVIISIYFVIMKRIYFVFCVYDGSYKKHKKNKFFFTIALYKTDIIYLYYIHKLIYKKHTAAAHYFVERMDIEYEKSVLF